MHEKNINISNLIKEVVTKTVKETLENIMNAERQTFVEEHNEIKNGYYTRDLGTKYGYIDRLKVPRDRGVNTLILQPYKRSFDLEDLVIALYSKGTSTRKIADILEELFTLFTKYNKSYYRYNEKRNSIMAE